MLDHANNKNQQGVLNSEQGARWHCSKLQREIPLMGRSEVGDISLTKKAITELKQHS
jgi:hypothetical protein